MRWEEVWKQATSLPLPIKTPAWFTSALLRPIDYPCNEFWFLEYHLITYRSHVRFDAQLHTLRRIIINVYALNP